MSPKPFTENDQREYGEDPLNAARGIINGLLISLGVFACVAAAILIVVKAAEARTNNVQPIAAPLSLTRAREACPNNSTIVECRGELRKAYAAIQWQRHERLHQGAYGVDHAIRLASALYGVPISEMRAVGACESHLTPTDRNSSSSASGLFQFLDSTWSRAGIPGFSVYDPYANAIAAARLVTKDHGWHEWSCAP